jgi:hypothetical protein
VRRLTLDSWGALLSIKVGFLRVGFEWFIFGAAPLDFTVFEKRGE